MKRTVSLIALALLLGWGAASGEARRGEGPVVKVEAVSFLGDTLRTPPMKNSTFSGRQMKLMKAEKKWGGDIEDVENLIWVGRRLAYLSRYREAIEVYSRGIEAHPDVPHLYRHRGHRYISTRQLDQAIADLERAGELMQGMEIEIEEDGLPNQEGIPTTTLQSNVWYHLGLAYYLKGDYESAERAYRSCLAVAQSDDSRISSSYWLYLTLKRLGRETEAQAVLDAVPVKIELLETEAYHEMLLLYKGERNVDAFMQKLALKNIEGATLAYGVSCKLEHDGRLREADTLRSKTLGMEEWSAFGYIAAEADLAREH